MFLHHVLTLGHNNSDRNTMVQKRFTAADLWTRIINTGWHHCTCYYKFYIAFITGYGRLMADGDYRGLMGIYLAAINPHLPPLGINGKN